MFLFVLFFYSIAQAEPTEVWDTDYTQKIINSKKTIQNLKDQKECDNDSPSASSVLNLFEILNKEETIQAVIKPYKKQFLCEVDNYVAEQNRETTEDQKFMLNYLDNSDHLFRYKMMSRHFPVNDFFPQDLAFCASRKVQKFSLKASHLALNRLNCFASNGGAVVKKNSEKQVDILLNQPFVKGLRQRVNCTLPSGDGQFFWFGKEFSILEC